MIPKLKDLLKEELFATISVQNKRLEIYKNPKSIKRMTNGLRAVSLPNGDFFVVDANNVIHINLHEFLKREGIKLPTMFGIDDIRTAIDSGYINWHRDGSTNNFYISESTGAKIPKKTIKNVNKYAKKVKQKNPAYKFIGQSIWDK